jgi:hypothetical protein
MIQDIIEEGEKEFDELFKSRLYYIIRLYKKGQETCEKNLLEDILDWHTSQQHKLLQSIVEMIDAEKSPKITRPIPCPDNNFGCAVYHFEEIEPKENEVLEKFKSKLLELD